MKLFTRRQISSNNGMVKQVRTVLNWLELYMEATIIFVSFFSIPCNSSRDWGFTIRNHINIPTVTLNKEFPVSISCIENKTKTKLQFASEVLSSCPASESNSRPDTELKVIESYSLFRYSLSPSDGRFFLQELLLLFQ